MNSVSVSASATAAAGVARTEMQAGSVLKALEIIIIITITLQSLRPTHLVEPQAEAGASTVGR